MYLEWKYLGIRMELEFYNGNIVEGSIVFPVDRFPVVIYENHIIGVMMSTLTIRNLGEMEQNFDYTCTVSINNIVIGSAT